VIPLLPVLIAMTGAPRAHPLHTTLTTIEWRAETRTVQVAVRVFSQDLRAAVARAPADSACGYARRAFVLTDASGRVLGAERCTVQEAEEVTWIRLEARVAAPAGLRVLNAFLFESFGDQVNVVQANLAGRSRTMLFTRGDEPKPVGE
jgi:uncharacterized protein DUF6702